MEGTATSQPGFLLRNRHLVESAIDLTGGTLGSYTCVTNFYSPINVMVIWQVLVFGKSVI